MKTEAGLCGCGIADTNSDGDAAPDCTDGCPSDAMKTEAGLCGCGIADTDADSNGVADCLEPFPVVDAGVSDMDGGDTSSPMVDAGVSESDAGAYPADSGSDRVDAGGALAPDGAMDGAVPSDAVDAGGTSSSTMPDAGCGCSVVGDSSGGPGASSRVALIVGLGLLLRVRRRRASARGMFGPRVRKPRREG
jgi:MYXO-CTERM domain-containing protein